MTLSVLSVGLCLTGFITECFASMAASCGALAIFGFGNDSTDVLMNDEGAQAESAIGPTKLPLMHEFFSVGTIGGAAIGGHRE